MHHHHHGNRITIGGGNGGLVNIIVMFLVGLLLAGMGVVFIVIATQVPILRVSFTGTGLLLGVIGTGMFAGGVWMWFRRQATMRIKATGIPGRAQIVGLTQTSMYVNGAPVVELQLQVTTPTQGSYTVSKRETVPLIMMGRLTSGQPLPVMVDPQSPMNVVIVWEQALGFG